MKNDVQRLADAMSALMNYAWPGDVRELEHAAARAVIRAAGPTVRLRDLPVREPRDRDLRAPERVSIERALARYDGNGRKAAEALKIGTVTLWRRMKYGLTS